LDEANAKAAPTATGLSMSTSTGREAWHNSQESKYSVLRNVHRTQRHSEAAGGVGGAREGEGMVGAWGELGKRRKRRRRPNYIKRKSLVAFSNSKWSGAFSGKSTVTASRLI
jgi:hypothetical protein